LYGFNYDPVFSAPTVNILGVKAASILEKEFKEVYFNNDEENYYDQNTHENEI
jgi:hypothetical protein